MLQELIKIFYQFRYFFLQILIINEYFQKANKNQNFCYLINIFIHNLKLYSN